MEPESQNSNPVSMAGVRHRFKLSWAGFFAVGAGVMIFVGMPGFRDDMGEWKKIIDAASEQAPIPWTVMFGGASLALVVAALPWAWPWLTRTIRPWVSWSARSAKLPQTAVSTWSGKIEKEPTAPAGPPEYEVMTVAEANRLQRERERIEAPPDTAPSPSERVAIEELRVLYRSTGKDASWQALKVFDDVRASIDNPLSVLLIKEIDAHRDTRDYIDAVLSDRSKASIKKVIEAFGKFFHQYIRTVRLTHLAANDRSFKPKSVEPYREWERRHEAFRNEARRTLQRADLANLRSIFESYGWQKRFADTANPTSGLVNPPDHPHYGK